MKVNTSSIFRTEKLLMSVEEKMLKVKLFLPGVNTMEPTRNGKFSISTQREKLTQLDSMRNSVSTEIDHSTLDLDFQ